MKVIRKFAGALNVTHLWLMGLEETMPSRDPADISETLRVPIAPDTYALVTITVEEEGLGHIDPPTLRRPGLTDLHLTIAAISAGKYTLAPQAKKQP